MVKGRLSLHHNNYIIITSIVCRVFLEETVLLVHLEREDRRETVACVVHQEIPVTQVCREREEKLVRRERLVWTESLEIRGQPDPRERLDRRGRGVPGESPGHRDKEANKDCRDRLELREITEILDFLDPLASQDLLAPLEIL